MSACPPAQHATGPRGAMLRAAACAALLALTGCSSSAPIEAWQETAEQYVTRHGHGNPASLTEFSDTPTRRTFNHLGKESTGIGPSRTDANGILVGYRRSGGLLWHVYLVGVVKQRGSLVDVNFDRSEVREVRAVALARGPGGLRWAMGERDEDATERYLSDQRRRWANGHADRDPDDLDNTRFPRPHDRFEMTGRGDRVTVRHEQTGASWQLQLAAKSAGRSEDGSEDAGERSAAR